MGILVRRSVAREALVEHPSVEDVGSGGPIPFRGTHDRGQNGLGASLRVEEPQVMRELVAEGAALQAAAIRQQLNAPALQDAGFPVRSQSSSFWRNRFGSRSPAASVEFSATSINWRLESSNTGSSTHLRLVRASSGFDRRRTWSKNSILTPLSTGIMLRFARLTFLLAST